MTTDDDDCMCLGCGHLVPRAEMLASDIDSPDFEPLDVSDIDGVRAAAVRTVRVEWRCAECSSAPPEREIVQ